MHSVSTSQRFWKSCNSIIHLYIATQKSVGQGVSSLNPKLIKQGVSNQLNNAFSSTPQSLANPPNNAFSSHGPKLPLTLATQSGSRNLATQKSIGQGVSNPPNNAFSTTAAKSCKSILEINSTRCFKST